ncbi:MAG: cytochrome C oxidase subunit IV family protein [Deltaproteobacteria bacterium]|nr:cytochrome C oxidase subunit IV family protein [Deltaproteobacteria bacterium]
MLELMRRTATVVWIVLSLATGVSWWLAEREGSTAGATVLIMLIAAFKARMVMLHFMELKAAPLPWRCVFEGWVVIFTGVILAGYWVSLAAPH